MSTPPRQPDRVIAQAMLAAAGETPPASIAADEVAALERLLAHAQRDTGQSRRVSDFLLAWWNSSSCGAFDLTSLWSLDTDIVADMTTVFGLIGRIHRYPDSLGYEPEFKAIVQAWRPELGD
jgi:hypothetical protein